MSPQTSDAKSKPLAVRCIEIIEKDWPGHVAVLWRKQCKNKTTHPSRRCAKHR